MRRQPTQIAMLVLSVLGVALASYLTYIHYSGAPPACTAGGACLKVQTSVWSRLDGVPVALIGLIGYVAILISQLPGDREQLRLAALGMTTIGFGFSAYLTYRELFTLHTLCEECAASAVIMTVLFVLAAIRFVSGSPRADRPPGEVPPSDPPATAGKQRAPAGAAGR